MRGGHAAGGRGVGTHAHPTGLPTPGMDINGAQFSLINAMRTGNVLLDMLIAMLIPFVFKLLFSDSRQLLAKLHSWLLMPAELDDDCVRQISFMSVGSSLAGRDHKNQVLQKAITLYMTEKVRVPFENKAQVSLTALHDTAQGQGPVDKYNPLARFRLTWQAPENEWVEIEPGLHFQQRTTKEGSEQDDDYDNRPVQRELVVFELKAAKPCGREKIDGFIERALCWYKEELLKLRDDARYMYTMVSSSSLVVETTSKKGAGSGETASGFRYKRYKLSNQKTFASLFFPEKETVLRLLSDFEAKSGKYGVAGYPHKLGLLLHGPPGTGKTSLIKALAHHTGRSIINVSLARITTNQQLMDLMYDLKLSVVGQDMPVSLGFKDVIFVMEDIDAASSIVHRRDVPASHLRSRKTTVETTRADGHGSVITEKVTREVSSASADEAAGAAVAELPRTSSEAGAAPKTDAEPRAAPTSATFMEPPPMSAPAPSVAPAYAAAAPPPLPAPPLEPAPHLQRLKEMDGEIITEGSRSALLAKLFSEQDELNLAGLLNVLDGVVDTPERMLVMTSNHPERLDPALIRPGRIDKQIFLGHLRSAEAEQMISHYFGAEVSDVQRRRIRSMLDSAALRMTPASMEQVCAEHESINAMIDALAMSCSGPMLVPSRGGSATQRNASGLR